MSPIAVMGRAATAVVFKITSYTNLWSILTIQGGPKNWTIFELITFSSNELEMRLMCHFVAKIV